MPIIGSVLTLLAAVAAFEMWHVMRSGDAPAARHDRPRIPVGRTANPLQLPAPRAPRPENQVVYETVIPAPRAPLAALDLTATMLVDHAAEAAYEAAMVRDYILVRAETNHVFEHGRAGTVRALNVWGDEWSRANRPADASAGAIHALEFVDIEGRPADVTEVDPGELWAGRWLVAHAAEDRDTLDALAAQVDDETLQARAITTLFTATAYGSVLRAA